ncbi:MAG: protein-glutamate O-methyltransferase CheR [Bacteroidota bacterium]
MNTKNKRINEIFRSLYAMDVSKYDDSFLNKSIQKRMAETACGSSEAYYALLEQDEEESGRFAESLQISYTEFFRNPLTFAVLETIVLPELLLKKASDKSREIRIWSAACASGQETYSLAMQLEELINGSSDKNSYRIFATDVSESEIKQARKGEYPESALNNLNLRRLSHWFDKQGETYAVKRQLMKNIDFSVFDLFNEHLACPPGSIFGDFDLVGCANLLFYYKPQYQEKILDKMQNSMAKGAYLLTGEAERSILLRNDYKEIFPQSAIFQKK